MCSAIVDAWMQFPNRDYLLDPMFDSLRRWPTHWRRLAESDPGITPDQALASLVQDGASRVIASAWWGPKGPMITNEEVAAVVRSNPDQVVGIASVDLMRPMDGVRDCAVA